MRAKKFTADDHYMVIEGIRSLLQHEQNLEWTGMQWAQHPVLHF